MNLFLNIAMLEAKHHCKRMHLSLSHDSNDILLCTSKLTLGRHVYSWESGKLSFWFLLYFQNLYAVKWDWFDAYEFTAFQTPFSHKKLHRIDLILPSCHLLETSRIKRTFSTMKLRFGMNQQLENKPKEPWWPFHNIFTQKQ